MNKLKLLLFLIAFLSVIGLNALGANTVTTDGGVWYFTNRVYILLVPTDPTQAVNKAYVDALIAAINGTNILDGTIGTNKLNTGVSNVTFVSMVDLGIVTNNGTNYTLYGWISTAGTSAYAVVSGSATSAGTAGYASTAGAVPTVFYPPAISYAVSNNITTNNAWEYYAPTNTTTIYFPTLDSTSACSKRIDFSIGANSLTINTNNVTLLPGFAITNSGVTPAVFDKAVGTTMWVGYTFATINSNVWGGGANSISPVDVPPAIAYAVSNDITTNIYYQCYNPTNTTTLYFPLISSLVHARKRIDISNDTQTITIDTNNVILSSNFGISNNTVTVTVYDKPYWSTKWFGFKVLP